jgi:hypothetical protein
MDYVNSIIPWQFGMTFILVIAALIFYVVRARNSRAARGESGHMSHPPADSHTTVVHAPPTAVRETNDAR